MRLSVAAEYLDCSVREVETLIKSEAFGAIQYGERGMRRILKTDLDRWLESRLEKRISA